MVNFINPCQAQDPSLCPPGLPGGATGRAALHTERQNQTASEGYKKYPGRTLRVALGGGGESGPGHSGYSEYIA